MSLMTTVLLLWLVGLPVGFWALAAVYPRYLRKRFLRPVSAPAVALVVALAEEQAAR
jgi:hypothetical protein